MSEKHGKYTSQQFCTYTLQRDRFEERIKIRHKARQDEYTAYRATHQTHYSSTIRSAAAINPIKQSIAMVATSSLEHINVYRKYRGKEETIFVQKKTESKMLSTSSQLTTLKRKYDWYDESTRNVTKRVKNEESLARAKSRQMVKNEIKIPVKTTKMSKCVPNDTSSVDNDNESTEEAAIFFRNQFEPEINRLTKLLDKWLKINTDDTKTIPKKYSVLIDEIIEQTRSLINNEIELIRTELTASHPIPFEDLEMTWRTVYMDIKNYYKRFENLEKFRANDWK